VFVVRKGLNGVVMCLELIGCLFGSASLRRIWSLGTERHVARIGKLKMTQCFCGKMRTKGVVRIKYRGGDDIKLI